MAEARAVKFCTVVRQVAFLHWENKLFLEWAWSRSRDVFTFSEISDNISEMVQDRAPMWAQGNPPLSRHFPAFFSVF